MSTSLTPTDLADLDRAQDRELLIGNGLGGYTALSPLGAPGRRRRLLHGLASSLRKVPLVAELVQQHAGSVRVWRPAKPLTNRRVAVVPP